MLVSEVMLQQTQVARVAAVYPAFLARFPSPAACAAAGAGAVVAAWAGLGYNRRAVRLHEAAVRIVEEHGGSVPDRLGALLALPGVGAYTARAVLAFAFEQPVGVVDTNAARVLARAVAGAPLGARDAQALADALVPPAQAWRHNQGMLDLGALVCRKAAPRCDVCPVAGACRWRRAGAAGEDPAAVAGSRQAPFEGSDRQGRGRLVAALRHGPVPLDRLAAAAGWPDDDARASRVARSLVADGLARREHAVLTLP